jgi:hypothetical protein
MEMDYRSFLDSKSQWNTGCGFEPVWMPSFLFDFQSALVEWAVRRGRAAIFASCGLGKTPMQLVWAENVVRHTNRPVLVLTPLAVAYQTIKEAEKFGIEAVRSRDGTIPSGARVVVTNYDQLHKFDPSAFVGAVADESACIKDMDSKRTGEVIDFLRTMPYRLLCSATPAPNDYDELGTSSEALGEMGYQDMLTKFFRKKLVSDYRGWSREKFQLKGHADRDFWRWVCSWARAVRKPSDLGFDDTRFLLPPLVTREHVVIARTKRDGYLFDLPATGLDEEREERRRTIVERCEKVAEIVAERDDYSICWCHLNDEGDELARLIPCSVQISGSDRDELKEERFLAFQSGQIRTLVTKPVIGAWGLNLQHCNHMTAFPSHSYEQYHQFVRRCWRFGQERPVTVDMISSEGEEGVLANLQRKADQAEVMFDMLVTLMNDSLSINRSSPFTREAEVPSWLSSTSGISSVPTGRSGSLHGLPARALAAGGR